MHFPFRWAGSCQHPDSGVASNWRWQTIPWKFLETRNHHVLKVPDLFLKWIFHPQVCLPNGDPWILLLFPRCSLPVMNCDSLCQTILASIINFYFAFSGWWPCLKLFNHNHQCWWFLTTSNNYQPILCQRWTITLTMTIQWSIFATHQQLSPPFALA